MGPSRHVKPASFLPVLQDLRGEASSARYVIPHPHYSGPSFKGHKEGAGYSRFLLEGQWSYCPSAQFLYSTTYVSLSPLLIYMQVYLISQR